MAKEAQIGIRVPHELKAAALRAAKDDHRSMASLVEIALTNYLLARDYLPRPEAAPGDDRAVS